MAGSKPPAQSGSHKELPMQSQPFDALPIWGMFILTVAFIFGFVEVGFRMGEAKR